MDKQQFCMALHLAVCCGQWRNKIEKAHKKGDKDAVARLTAELNEFTAKFNELCPPRTDVV